MNVVQVPVEEQEVLDPVGWVPQEPTAEEIAAVQVVFAQQDAQDAADPRLDPMRVEHWQTLADIEQTLAVEWAQGGELASGLPAQELTGGLSGARTQLGRAGLGSQDTARLSEPDLVPALEAAAAVTRQALAVVFALAREASVRKLHLDTGTGLVDWLSAHCPGLPASLIRDLAVIAAQSEKPGTQQIADAVGAGTVPVHRAAKVCRTLSRLRSSLDVDQQEAYADIALGAAANPQLSDKDLGMVCHKLVEDLLDEALQQDKERIAQDLRGVSARPVGEGMTRYTIDAPADGAAIIDGILNSRLAAPAPDDDGPDPRSATQRKYDALLTVLNRGLGNPGAAPSQARASVIITLKGDPDTGQPTGGGHTMTGQWLSARHATRMSCGSEITTIWVGTEGQPLNMGRTKRLATPGQFKALYLRDQHCSYPGCTVPPTWCDAHHITWWTRNGHTDLDNLTLLCPRHHTHVHAKDLTATFANGQVTWHR